MWQELKYQARHLGRLHNIIQGVNTQNRNKLLLVIKLDLLIVPIFCLKLSQVPLVISQNYLLNYIPVA